MNLRGGVEDTWLKDRLVGAARAHHGFQCIGCFPNPYVRGGSSSRRDSRYGDFSQRVPAQSNHELGEKMFKKYLVLCLLPILMGVAGFCPVLWAKTLSWDPVGNDILEYRIYYWAHENKLPFQKPRKVVSVDSGDTWYDVEQLGLETGSRYYFQVVAVNALGESIDYDVVTWTVEEEEPPTGGDTTPPICPAGVSVVVH